MSYEVKPIYTVRPSFHGFGDVPSWWDSNAVVTQWKSSIDSTISASKRNLAGARMAIKLKAALSQLGYAVLPQLEGGVAWGKLGGAALSAFSSKTGRPSPAPGGYPTKALILAIGEDLAANRVTGPSAPVVYSVEEIAGGATAVPVSAGQPAATAAPTTQAAPPPAATAAATTTQTTTPSPQTSVSTTRAPVAAPAPPPPATTPAQKPSAPVTQAAAVAPIAPGLSTNMKIGLGLGAVAILGLAVVLATRKKKSATGPSAPQLPAATPNRRSRRRSRRGR